MRVLVTGAGGQLGQDLRAVLERPGGDEVVALDHRALPVDDAEAVDRAFDEHRPEVVVHAAALTNVDRCETEPELARAINAVGTRNVAGSAGRVGAHLVCISTDYVFDGLSTRPYRVSDETNPVSVYGQTKLEGERACPSGATIVRTSWLAGAGAPNFVSTVLGLAGGTETLRFVDDQFGSPTFTADLAPAIVALARDRRPGVFHVTNAGETSRFELARETVALAGGDPERVVPIRTDELQPPRPATRPPYSVLDNSAFEECGYPALPSWRDGLARLVSVLRGAT